LLSKLLRTRIEVTCSIGVPVFCPANRSSYTAVALNKCIGLLQLRFDCAISQRGQAKVCYPVLIRELRSWSWSF